MLCISPYLLFFFKKKKKIVHTSFNIKCPFLIVATQKNRQ